MWSGLLNWMGCARRRPHCFAWQPFQVLHLQEGLQQDMAEWLDWASLAKLQCTSRGSKQLIHSETFLALLARRRGLMEEPSIVCRCLQSLALAEELRRLKSAIFFERASTCVREESDDDLRSLAVICRRHPEIVIFISGHCGRNAPESIKASFTLERAKAVCDELQALIGPDLPAIYVHGCGSTVAARDIPAGGAEDWSKADLRVELQTSRLLVDWGRKWWQPVLGGDELEPPEWQPFRSDEQL
mmetsp:Transcript_58093/g.129692  ORF Transcript_58093/g.129692 Transcript_58093/m.129692 type:complete len:244 (-) Transcript_58093:80-811(-)